MEIQNQKRSWLTDDFLAIFIAGVIVLFTIFNNLFDWPIFSAVKFSKWGTMSELINQLFVRTFTWQYLLTAVILTMIYAGAEKAKKGQKWAVSIKSFLGIYLLATIVYILSAQQTMKEYLEYAFWALLIGLIVRNVIGVPKWLEPALRSEFYIKIGLVLMGAEVLFSNITKFGIYGIMIVLIVVPLTMTFMWYFGTKFLQMRDGRSVMVIATATAVCGVSAAIASAAAVKAKKQDLSFAVSMSIMFTIVMMVAMPLIARWLGLTELVGGAWIGNTVDSTGAVVLAGEALGPLASQVASLIKMIQNLLIGFVVFLLAIFFARREQLEKIEEGEGHVEVHSRDIWDRLPKFILGFLAMSLIFSFIILPLFGIESTNQMIASLGTWKGWFFCLTFLAIGLETDFKMMKEGMEGGKPVSLYVVGQLFSVFLSLLICWLLLSGKFFAVPDLMMIGG
ncbi:putative sulfate exporter family transporter [Facklamia sp. DSM 111018]|uniref:Sulfate exporter family transporter n=1 Tax=Facklamia lactis TaxID=2749967 RepID=A0ABS0LQN3_9LACT|nr:putative sulfate exporter family transporter [Facklamia lactis]MBG9980656.1 putative sulfate exporter family transporter [Facklamia lactis]MBG9986470.1 putative sulfate exporter family transporter [Facklamia lactis]